MPKNNVN